MKMYSEYRAQARETLKGLWSKMAFITLILIALAVVCCLPMVSAERQELDSQIIISAISYYILLFVILYPLEFAYNNLILGKVRGEETEGNLFVAICKDAMNHWKKYVLCSVLIMVLILIPLVPTLCIVSFILAFAYSIVPFVIRDNPELGIRDVLKTSRLMMRGHKGQLFVLELTFIGWIVLGLFSLGIAYLWILPYMTASMAHFYEDVKAEYTAQTAVEPAPQTPQAAQD